MAEPAVSVKEKKTTEVRSRDGLASLRWISKKTEGLISDALQGENHDTCGICGHVSNSTQRVKVHIKQHFCRSYCLCSYGSVSRDAVLEHQRRAGRTPEHGGPMGCVYDVDKDSYESFTEHVHWTNPPPFEDCHPTLVPLTPRVKGSFQRKSFKKVFPRQTRRCSAKRNAAVVLVNKDKFIGSTGTDGEPMDDAAGPSTSGAVELAATTIASQLITAPNSPLASLPSLVAVSGGGDKTSTIAKHSIPLADAARIREVASLREYAASLEHIAQYLRKQAAIKEAGLD